MPNPVNWFEIPVQDMNRAKEFYTAVFGYQFDMMEKGPLQLAMFSGSEQSAYGATGALAKGEGYEPSTTGSIVYFGCEDVNVELEKIEKAGGKVLFPKTSIGEHGFIAHFIDCEGNHVALHSMK